MKVHIIAVGRLRGGPEADLISDYLTRFDRTGRALSLGPAQVVEVDDRKGGGMAAEAELLRRAVPKGALLAVMDERGRVESSPKFAERLAGWRDGGRSDLALVIGGADGIDPSLRAEADFALSFGAMVWPHMLVRVMLAEQLYRAASILAGAPYHRD
ncbi:23S rRNA (pseudouridine(1915)-N(3))-methyltransferase RlmH [Sulfitobacter pseudonitzschiae]|uniref:Ribosomal RNA large subunit methyltransferase H n=1 Tax=Pseudosulfitobacter pseudonitzschiae TaxID=1402135 RepID=A0A073J905_9RHOB|nr:23S rRNA (pseudouridine(1915)-N(3))-methyltransferase RlmH [Pseudosulfitobacter pseudonitzschiae]KEJ94207.1 50S rRNA methyltransferase [Pseudosulfitobacter pseudonitzschiae]MBM2294011.1 23S rRNA (pseudouridine(1915)-N(3))-methyltransferase RlmH [Pseudosulfitobacter pseudonitzschiae]MBM2298934.1 23S rRNA (pseudouridine(1915)-N(3))-methyltransferase RlmH [Pseudosulfitobacter pseudonitzschiae]MBM2303842.1 23S rRNA (pseudouridine(1915)-N(3))-methyltransferase RlmH [Pseudosulfitobacter pseudonitz|tara:strand:+ start:278 stop:748 length:471 start_codon:yes stop_codon:yes gene_type:complete